MQCVRRDRRADPILVAVAFASSYVICLLHFMPCTAPIPCHAGRTTFVSCGINVDNVAGQQFVTLLEHACRFVFPACLATHSLPVSLNFVTIMCTCEAQSPQVHLQKPQPEKQSQEPECRLRKQFLGGVGGIPSSLQPGPWPEH